MIPTIEDIIKGLLSGDYAVEKAAHWIDEHLRLAYAEGRKDEREELGQVCPSCKGSGERTYQHLDEYEQGDCDRCGGLGMIAKLSPEIPHYVEAAEVRRDTKGGMAYIVPLVLPEVLQHGMKLFARREKP